MLVKNKNIGLVIFLISIFLGWIAANSLSKNNSFNFKKIGSTLWNVLGESAFSFDSDYITPNQLNVDILHYDLEIDLYPSLKLLKGQAVITGVIMKPDLKQIDLNFYDNLKITNLSLNDSACKYENKRTRLSIFCNQQSADTFKLLINYEGTPKRAGLSGFVFGELNGNSVIYNLSEPSYASTWFPCNDFPSDKALIDIRITNDSSQTSVSNGILVSKQSIGSRKTYHWRTLYPISTYLICLYSSKYNEFTDRYISASNDTMNLNYFVFPEHEEKAKVDFKNTPEIISFFASTFGEYPFIKEKYGIAEFLWQMGAMEHQTITGIGSNFINGKNYFEDVYIHELAHHWWGNAVGPSSWKDIWLNEGFATYSEALYEEFLHGQNGLKSKMLGSYSDSYMGTVYDPGSNLFNSTVYDKGAWVLHMLRWEIGDSIFFQVLRTYFETYKYKNASTFDFISLCEKLSQKNLKKFFDQWVFTGTDNIKLDYKWIIKPTENNKHLVLLDLFQRQENYHTFEFNLEVMLEYDNNRSFSKIFNITQRQQRIEFILDEKPNQLILDPNNWILADIKDRNSYEN